MSENNDKSDATPKREPFHFHFPDGSSVWVEVEQDSNGEWKFSEPAAAKMLADTLNSIQSSQTKPDHHDHPDLPLDG